MTEPTTYSKPLTSRLPFAIRMCELFGDDVLARTPARTDVVFHRQSDDPLPGFAAVPFHTLALDLAVPEANLLAGMEKNTRNEARRAVERDGLVFGAATTPAATDLGGLVALFNRAAASKGRTSASLPQLSAWLAAGRLRASRVDDPAGNPLAIHFYYCTATTIFLTHSASFFRDASEPAQRALVGRANRGLHWTDISCARADGFRVYDFGGWYASSEDAERLRINAFKAGFGGTVRRQWNCHRAQTLRGRIYLWARARSLSARR